jgi:hypothetical protein
MWKSLMNVVGGGEQVIEAKTPQPVVGVEGEDARVDARYNFSSIETTFFFFLTMG